MRPLLFACTLLALGCRKAPDFPAAPTDVADLDRYLEDVRERVQTPGLAVAVVHAQELVYSGGVGVANVETQLDVEADTTVFLIASISKTVTSVAAMQLVEDGALFLDDDVDVVLPFELSGDAVGPITTRNLLAHTSGLRDAHYNRISDMFYTYDGTDPSVSLAEFSQGMLAEDGAWIDRSTFSVHAGGDSYDYSNLGFALLGHVVEVRTGVPFQDHTRARIFEPLGMTRTAWHLSDLGDQDLAMPYHSPDDPVGHFSFADYPNGSLRTTVVDLSRFLRAIIAKGELDGVRILRESTVDQMMQVPFADVVPDQAHGWDVSQPTGGV
ncbi:MAG: CubicO group peptidase (beta-lactamase class C family), partial [Kiritimatiellia bacterium]